MGDKSIAKRRLSFRIGDETTDIVMRFLCLLPALILLLGLPTSSFAAKKKASSRKFGPPSKAVIENDYFEITKTAPSQVSQGKQFTWEYYIKTKNRSLDSLTINDSVPEGAEFLSSTVESGADGKPGLIWSFYNLKPKEERSIKVTLQANKLGDLSSVFNAVAVPVSSASVSTNVGYAKLSITKKAPGSVFTGDNYSYTLTVRNEGTLPARNVVVQSKLSPEIQLKSDEDVLNHEFGNIDAGESKTLTVEVNAAKRGESCIVAKVASENAGNDSTEICTKILKSSVDIAFEGEHKQYVGKKAAYVVLVHNDGDAPLESLLIKNTAPKGTRIVSAPEASSVGNDSANWEIAKLAVDEMKAFEISIISAIAGKHCSEVEVTTKRGDKKASVCTDWTGVPALSFNLIDERDALIIDDKVDYIIRAINQGTAADRNVSISIVCPEGLKPLAATGPTKASIAGQLVKFQNVAELQAGKTVEFRLTAQAVKAGEHRVEGKLNSEHLDGKEIIEFESTTIY